MTNNVKYEVEDIVIRLHELARTTGDEQYRYTADKLSAIVKRG